MEWIPTADRMPPAGTPVLADTGHKHPIRACWVAKFSEEVGASDFDGDEDYDEKTDTSYWPEGWYEWNRYEETHWRVDVPVTHWMPLPAPLPPEIPRRGEWRPGAGLDMRPQDGPHSGARRPAQGLPARDVDAQALIN